MNTSGFIAILVALGLGFLGGYKYATRPVPDTGGKTRIIYRDRSVKPPEPENVQTPDVRIVHVVSEPDTVCLVADPAFTQPHAIESGVEGVTALRMPLRTSWLPAVTYVDPATDRLAVTRTRSGSIRIPYTYNGRTMIDEYYFRPPSWDLYVELEGLVMGDSFAALAPDAFQGSAMAWVRIRSVHLGAGVRAGVREGEDATVGSVAGVRWRPWELR